MFSFVRALAKPENRYAAWIAILAAIGGFLFGFGTGVDRERDSRQRAS